MGGLEASCLAYCLCLLMEKSFLESPSDDRLRVCPSLCLTKNPAASLQSRISRATLSLFVCFVVLCTLSSELILVEDLVVLLARCQSPISASLYRTFRPQHRSIYPLCNHLDIDILGSKAMLSDLESRMQISSYAKLGAGASLIVTLECRR